MPTDIKLPELGENIEGGDVLRVMVKAGDNITKDQPVLEIETDKATIEVPSSAQGVIKEIKVKPGEKVKVGQTIIVVDENGAGAAREQAPVPPKPAEAAPAPQAPPKRKAEVVEMNRPKPSPATEAPRVTSSQGPVSAPAERSGRLRQGYGEPHQSDATAGAGQRGPASGATIVSAEGSPRGREDGGASIPAAPSARRLARELGLNIQDIQGSGPGGRISMDDVSAYARRLLSGEGAKVATAPPLPDFSAWGPIERKSMSGVRRTTAHRLTHAWTTVPHVFQHDRADITTVDALRKRLSKKAEAEGRAPITITAFLIKILAAALHKFPQANSSVDLQTDEIIYKQYINIGVAVDTDRGLLVPVIRGADQKDIFQLADEVARAAEKARNRKLTLEDMQGGSMSISNLGGLGGGAFTPIVNWPEVAILGVARARMEPLFVDGEFVPRLMMPLTLSYDHRVIDGADAVRMLRWIVEAVEQPALIWLDQ
jgi:pyruvate dehydrogenase E2 component (dihydrolipoyllysine-residue acetyltransferase)